jgi:hypothetical protein
MSTTFSILSFIIAIITFIITFKISNFFIAPRENRRLSGFAILMLKLGMAGGTAFLTFIYILVLFGGKR